MALEIAPLALPVAEEGAAEKAMERTADLFGQLALDDHAAGQWDASILDVELTESQRTVLLESAAGANETDPPLIGVNVASGRTVTLAPEDLAALGDEPTPMAGGVARRLAPGGGYAWTLAVRSSEAFGLRFHFADCHLPPGAKLFVYGFGDGTGEVYGPYEGDGPLGTGEFWTHSLIGGEGFIELQIAVAGADPASASAPAPATQAIRFIIQEVAVMGPLFFPGLQAVARSMALPQPESERNTGCLIDAGCAGGKWANLDMAGRGMAQIDYPDAGGHYRCSGGLIADSTYSGTPYFLTANHCIDNEYSAAFAEFTWEYRAHSCGGYTESRGYTEGARYLVSSTYSDYCLMKLYDKPPSGVTLLGWSSKSPRSGTVLYRLSHPHGMPMNYSTQKVIGGRYKCFSSSRFISSMRREGSTMGGSSGSPILNANAMVVGQLYGKCGKSKSDLENICGGKWDILDGRFSATFKKIRGYLAPETCKYSRSISKRIFAAKGGTGKIVVGASGACPWTVSSDAEWIQFTAATSGRDRGVVTFLVGANSGVARSAMVNIAGKAVLFKQKGAIK